MADEVTTPDGTPTPEPTPTTPAATPAFRQAQDAAPEKTFTQAELDKLISERLKREREKHADYDTLKEAAAELAKIKESQLSETEKLQKRLTELEAAKTQAETQARQTLIRSAVISEAAKLNFNDPQDAYRLIDVATLEIADNGEVKGVGEAVRALAESRKYLLKNNNPALSPFNPAGSGNNVQETDAQRRARIYGGGGNYFDPGQAEQKGGGVVLPKGVWPEQS